MGIPREGESGGKLTPNCFQSFDCFDPLRFYPKKVDVNCATRRWRNAFHEFFDNGGNDDDDDDDDDYDYDGNGQIVMIGLTRITCIQSAGCWSVTVIYL